MAVSKVSQRSFNKADFAITTGAGNYKLPRSMTDTLYGPGWPVQPITRPEDSDLPRTLDYPVGINYTLQPRVGYAGLMPVAALKAAYTNITEVATPVNLIIRELSGFQPMLRDKKTQLRVKEGHPYSWMVFSPDRVNPFNVWLSKYKKSAKVYAAPCFYKRKESGRTVAMEYIDGSTFFLIINSRGDLPEPDEVDPEVKKFVDAIRAGDMSSRSMPDIARVFLEKQKARVEQGKSMASTTPAFTQIIKGIPFSFWDKSQVYFIPESPAPSVDSPYGESFIERAWTWINIIAVMTAFELEHYRTGNTPEGLMTLPKDMFPSMAKLAIGEREWNARMADGSQVQHARNRWMPEGTQYIPTKKSDFPKDLYGQAVDNILHSIGVPVSEIGKKGGAGLGGKGFEAGVAHDVTRQLLEGEKTSLENPFNKILLEDGVDDVEFYMDYPQEEIDPEKQQEDLWQKFSHGVATLNDVFTAQNKQPIGKIDDPENVANMHLIVAGTTIFVVEKMKADETGIIAPKQPAPTGFAAQSGSPNNPEDVMQGDKKGLPADKDVTRAIAKAIEESGGRSLSNVTYSIPALEKKTQPFETLKRTALNMEEYAMGLKEEQEHADTVDGDQEVIARIVEDHLREDPQYYTHLKSIEKGDTKNNVLQKHCGVCPEDVEYFGAPIMRDNALVISSGRHHANEVDVVTMQPKGLPSVLALFKPAGGEKVTLNESIGGVQYVREEAAWLLDQSLGFNLVPLSYVTESPDGEEGAVLWYTAGDTKRLEPKDYAPEWIEKAGVLDYIMTQLDRRGKNFLTHPDDSKRMILIDNGYAFPSDKSKHPNCKSDFASLMIGKLLSDDALGALKQTAGDLSMWQDVEDLIGKDATANAQKCLQELLIDGQMKLEAT